LEKVKNQNVNIAEVEPMKTNYTDLSKDVLKGINYLEEDWMNQYE